jgi:nicotinamide-nucleotide amidase
MPMPADADVRTGPLPAATDADLAALVERLATGLERHRLVVAAAESCTGGWVARCLTDRPGSSAWFGYGLVTYANEAKVRLLGVDPGVLAAAGAVSEPVARQMAAGLRRLSGADLTVAVTGIAGPGGGTPAKPVGTVWFAWEGPGAALPAALRWQLPGSREAIRRQAVAIALAGLVARLDGA